MDDNTTKVVLTAIALTFVVAIIRQFDRVSLHIERLKLDIFGLLRVGTRALDVVLEGRQWSKQDRTSHRGGGSRASQYIQGSFALTNSLRVALGDHNIDMIIVTHPDSDHLNGLLHLGRREVAIAGA